MSDFEIALLFSETVDSVSTQFVNIVSIVSGFLLAGFFGAQLLTRLMLGIVIGIYSTFIFFIGFSVVQDMRSLMALALEIQGRVDAGSEALAWHAVKNSPQFMIAVGPPAVVIILALSYAASLAFFYERRMSTQVK